MAEVFCLQQMFKKGRQGVKNHVVGSKSAVRTGAEGPSPRAKDQHKSINHQMQQQFAVRRNLYSLVAAC